MKHAMNPQNPTKSLCNATSITAENVALNPSQITCKRCLSKLASMHNAGVNTHGDICPAPWGRHSVEGLDSTNNVSIKSEPTDVEMQDELFESQPIDELPDFSQSTCPIDGRVGYDCRLCITCTAPRNEIDPSIVADFTAIQHDESDEALVKFVQAEQAKALKTKKFKAPRICYHGEIINKGLCNIPGGIQTVHTEDVTCKVCLSKLASEGKSKGRMHYNHSGSTLCSMIIPSPLNFTRDRTSVTCKVCLKMLEDI
jgi:hypothetical protein